MPNHSFKPKPPKAISWLGLIQELDASSQEKEKQRHVAKRGHKAAAIDKLLGGNWYRLLRDVLG